MDDLQHKYVFGMLLSCAAYRISYTFKNVYQLCTVMINYGQICTSVLQAAHAF